jgi:hypothetical protein
MIPGRDRAVLPLLTLALPGAMRCHVAAVLKSDSGEIIRLCSTLSGHYTTSEFRHLVRRSEHLAPAARAGISAMATAFVAQWKTSREAQQLIRPHLGVVVASDRMAEAVARRGPLVVARVLAWQIANGTQSTAGDPRAA